MKLAILGDGAWGTATALHLARKPEHQVVLWSARRENARLLRERRENVRLLPGVNIPDAIELTEDVRSALDAADVWIVAVPTIHLRATLQRIAAQSPPPPPAMLSLTKGLENETFALPTRIFREVIGEAPQAVLSGPSHAEEVSRRMPTSVVIASEDGTLAQRLQHCFNDECFRAYVSSDVLGVEMAGALKNVLGIAAGISDGLGLGDNSKAALLTRGLVEMTRLGVALGAEAQTFSGLAGLGDVITTCMSPHGRNRSVGERLGRGETLEAILDGMTKIAEGVHTTKSVHEQAQRMQIDMPITRQVYHVLYDAKDPREAVSELMLRRPRGEHS